MIGRTLVQPWARLLRARMGRAGRRAGFSLIELVIVIVIMGIIAAIAIPRVSRGASNAQENAVKASLRTVRTALEMYKVEVGDLPPNADSIQIDQALTTVWTTSGGLSVGPYLHAIPTLILDGASNTGTNIVSDGVPTGGSYSSTGGAWGYVSMNHPSVPHRGWFYASGSTEAQRDW